MWVFEVFWVWVVGSSKVCGLQGQGLSMVLVRSGVAVLGQQHVAGLAGQGHCWRAWRCAPR